MSLFLNYFIIIRLLLSSYSLSDYLISYCFKQEQIILPYIVYHLFNQSNIKKAGLNKR